jgi:hypothetical protein
MQMNFEPGDGSFEVILEAGESVPPQWNTTGVTIWRKLGDHHYAEVKSENEILSGICNEEHSEWSRP